MKPTNRLRFAYEADPVDARLRRGVIQQLYIDEDTLHAEWRTKTERE